MSPRWSRRKRRGVFLAAVILIEGALAGISLSARAVIGPSGPWRSVALGTSLLAGMIFAIALSALTGLEFRVLRIDRAGVERRERIRLLSKNLSTAVDMIAQLEEELRAGAARADDLRAEVERYQSVAVLQAEEVEAVVEVLRAEMRREERRGLLKEVLINFGFFVAGIAVTAILG